MNPLSLLRLACYTHDDVDDDDGYNIPIFILYQPHTYM